MSKDKIKKIIGRIKKITPEQHKRKRQKFQEAREKRRKAVERNYSVDPNELENQFTI